MDLGERLRAEIPALEPDPVLLAQLVQLSTAAAQRAAPRRAHGARAVLIAAGAAGIVSGTAWLAGALPGTASPWHPPHHSHPVPSKHTGRPPLRHLSTPTAPGAAGSADLPEGRSPADTGSGSASHPARPSHPSHPAHPSRSTQPSSSAHPSQSSASAHPTPSAHATRPTHPGHHPKHQGHLPHPSPR